jgi:hypothetical protein
MRFDPKAAERHLKALRNQHEITRKWIKRWQRSYALLAPRLIYAPKVSSPIEYLINLHEMGHVVSSTARRYQRFPSTDLHADMMREAAAWAWALLSGDPSILDTVPEKDWALMADCLVTYFRAAAGPEVSLLLPEDALLD